MLVLSRRRGQRVIIGQQITITIVDLSRGRVKLGFEGPREIAIHREEVRQRIDQDRPAMISTR
ncbi:MAG: carbon storage regulator [Thermoguttaceae bacterium]